jgi:capsular polysaccharide biosynthesis protein
VDKTPRVRDRCHDDSGSVEAETGSLGPIVSAARCWRSALRNWYLLLLCAGVAAGATLFLTLREQPEYSSNLRLAVGPSPSIRRSTLVAETVDALNKRALITTLAEIAGGQAAFREAATTLGLAAGESARYTVRSVALPEANVIALEVRGPRRHVASALASAISGKAITSITSFYKNLAVRQLDEASRPSDPISPKPWRDVPLAAAIGLCVGFFLGLCRDYLRERKGRDQELERTEP